MQTAMILGVETPRAVEARKTAALTQVGLVGDNPCPWLFVMPEVGAPRPMRAGAVMVAGHYVKDLIEDGVSDGL
jgi:hypothetical protein